MSGTRVPAAPDVAPRTALGLACALAALVHLGALANGFAYDDLVLIAGDEGLRSLSGLPARLMQPSWPAAFAEEVGAWRPVTTGVWALTWIASGGAPIAFHALGIVLHVAATALVVLLLLSWVAPFPAALGGMLFAVHPVHVEAVANVAGTAEPLAAALALGALLVHVRGGPRYGVRRALVVATLYAAAVLAKEGAAVLPVLVLLADGATDDVPLSRLGAYARRRGALYALLASALAFVLVFRLGVVGAVAGATYPPGAEALLEAPRVWTVLSTWPHVVRLLLFPAELSADYAPAVIPVVFGWSPAAVLGAALGLVGMGGALVLWRRAGSLAAGAEGSDRIVALGIVWCAAALLPVANVLYLGPVLVAERTLYLPSVGACAAGGWLLARLWRRRPEAAAALTLVVLALACVRTVTRVPVWDSSETVMAALAEDHPEAGRGWMELGRRLVREQRPREALTAFRYAIGLLNSEYKESTEIASHLIAIGRAESARPLLRRAWREHPEWYTAPGLLAAAELASGRLPEAAAAARAATVLEPSNPSMHHLLAQALSGMGRHAEAAEARWAALRRGHADRSRSWRLLGSDYASMGDTLAALAALDSALARAASDTEVAEARALRTTLDPSHEPPSPE